MPPLRILSSSALLLGATSFASASEFILCQAPQVEDVIIELNVEKFEDRELSCIRGGGGFYVDMTPCAPDGGYSLSMPTGAADLVEVVDRWQDYGDHLGGVVGFAMSQTTYWFQGGFMGSESGYNERWTFHVSRLTGIGKLSQWLPDDNSDERHLSVIQYQCAPAKQKF